MLGTCKFCGQMIEVGVVEHPDEAAMEYCDCPGAKEERRIVECIAEACNNIEALFGERAEEFGFRKIEPRETVEELCQLAEYAARGYLRQASIKLSGTITATIAAKADKIEISRKTTSSQKLEAKMMV